MLIDQIPRKSLLWMIGAVVAACLPHWPHAPGWLWLAMALVFGWRVQIYRGRLALPSFWIKALLVLICGLAVWRAFGNLRGLEPMTALLIAGLVLKCLEMRNRRDALLVVLLGYFVTAAQLLYSTQLLASLYALVCIWALLVAQQLLFSGAGNPFKAIVKHSGVMLLQALPVMLALFLLMPRLAPLWAMPSQQHAARTGISDTMAPGDVVDLTQSGKLAFRVSFEGDVPPPEARYWRGLVMSEFDGRTWRRHDYDFLPGERAVDLYRDQPSSWRMSNLLMGENVPVYQYELLMEETHQSWLFTLGLPVTVSMGQAWGITRDHTLFTLKPMRERNAMTITSADLPMPQSTLHAFVQRRYLALPEGYNPRTLALAKSWMAERDSADFFVEKFRQWVASRFVYTLQPPGLGRDSVDEFLFTTQQGFCEHFASSFVVMARAAGIPARVVTGYQGGELSVDGQYLLVHQMDAHAWAELWIDGQWQRIDPTAFVAPERIRMGLRDSMREQQALLGEPMSLMRFSYIATLNQLRLQWDYVNYLWQSRVAGFDRDTQQGLLDQWLGGRDPLQLALAFLLLVLGPLVLVALWMMWSGRPAPEPMIKRLMRQVTKGLGPELQRRPGETLGDFFRRLARAMPAREQECLNLARVFDHRLYGPGTEDARAEQLLRQWVTRFSKSQGVAKRDQTGSNRHIE